MFGVNVKIPMPEKKWAMSQRIHKRCEDIFVGIELLENFMNEFEIFVDTPEYKLKVFEFWTWIGMLALYPIFRKFSWDETYPFVRLELDKVKDKTALAASFFSQINISKFHLDRYREMAPKILEKVNDISKKLQNRMELIQNQTIKIKQLEKQLAELKSREAFS